jgi:ATP-dependent RNA helicase RhlE
MFVDKMNKVPLLIDLLKQEDIESALVFSRTKHGADKIVKYLGRAGLSAQAIHGNKSQNARQFALNNFKERKTRILIATDIAARGLDIDQLSHVFNVDLPEVAETYVHRIGRTGRAGLGGTAISFCSQDEKPYLKAIEKLIGKSIFEVKGHNYPITQILEEIKEEKHVRTVRPQPTKKPFIGKSATAKKEKKYFHSHKKDSSSASHSSKKV